MTESTRLNDFVFVMYATLRRNEPPSGFGNKIVEALVAEFKLRTARDNPPSGIAFRKAFACVKELKQKEAENRKREATAKDAWVTAYARRPIGKRVDAPAFLESGHGPDTPNPIKLRNVQAKVEKMFADYRATQPAMPEPPQKSSERGTR